MRRIDWLLVWLLCFGVWPFADPGHELGTIGSAIDVGIHFTALIWLLARWQVFVVRRRVR